MSSSTTTNGIFSSSENNANPLLPDTITILPFHKSAFTFCLNDGSDEEECYHNQPKLYNVLKAFDPSNYEGTYVYDLPEGVEEKEEELDDEEDYLDLEVEEDDEDETETEEVDETQKENEVEEGSDDDDSNNNPLWKKWKKIVPGRFMQCYASLPDVDDYYEDYYEHSSEYYIILREPLMDVDGTFVGIQSMEDGCNGGQIKTWVSIEWLLEWCKPLSLEEGNGLFETMDGHNNKFHYMVLYDNPIYHRSFSVLNLDGIINSSKEEEEDGTLRLAKKKKKKTTSDDDSDDNDESITLFTYTDLFYVEQKQKQSGGDNDYNDNNDNNNIMVDLRDFKLKKHPIPSHLGIDLSTYGYQVFSHLSMHDEAVTMIDSKYTLYELYNNTDASSNFPPTYGTVQQALDDTTTSDNNESDDDDQVFYIKHCCDARGRGIGLYKRSVLQSVLDETKANYKQGLVEEPSSDVDNDEDIQLLKEYLTNHLIEEEEEDLLNASEEEYYEKDGLYVVQKAVHDLYTLDYGPLKNRRFDIRFYVIIARGKVYMHANGHMKWVIGDFEFDPTDTTLHKQVSNIAVYGGGDTARFVFPYEVDGNDSWKARRNMKKDKPSSPNKTSDSTRRFDPYGWRDAVSQALDKSASAVFEHARIITEQDPNKYVMMGGDAVIRANGEASIIEFNVWPDVDKFGRFNNCLGNDKSNCRRMVMLEHDTYGMMDNNSGVVGSSNNAATKEEEEGDDRRPGYFVTDLNIITDVISSEGLARVMRDMAILVTGIRPPEDIVGLREIGSQFVVKDDDE